MASYTTLEYFTRRTKPYLLWAAGLWLFVGVTILQIMFSYGIYDVDIAIAYIFVNAFAIEVIALGQIQLIRSEGFKLGYFAFCCIVTGFLAYMLLNTPIGGLLSGFVVHSGALPSIISLAYDAVVFPASLVILLVAVKGYMERQSIRLLNAMTGAVLLGIANGLYLTRFPALPYVAQFFAILFLWKGLYDFNVY